jgi:isopenicillin N synthase-like dioxygenase
MEDWSPPQAPSATAPRAEFDDGSAFRAIMTLERSADRLQAAATERARAAWAATQGMTPDLKAQFEANAAAHQASMTAMVHQLRALAALLLRTAVDAGKERADHGPQEPTRFTVPAGS